MKKIIFSLTVIAAIIVSIFSCDTRKFLKDSTPEPIILIDSISFTIVKQEGDTIYTFNKRNSSYTLILTAFDKNKTEIKNTKVPISISYLTELGINKIDNKYILNDSILLTNKTYSLDYYPDAKENASNIFVYKYTNNEGKIYLDTVNYYVYKYQPIAFSIITKPNNIPFIRPTSTFNFKVNLISKDESNQMKYKIKFQLPNSDISIFDFQGNSVGNPNNMILLLGDNNFTAKLINHIAGSNYNVKAIVYDENGDEQSAIVSYTVKYNEAPIITNFTYSWDTIYRFNDGVTRYGPINAPISGGPNCYNYTFLEWNFDLVLNYNITYDDDIECKQVVITSSRGFNKTTNLYNFNTNTVSSINNGIIKFKYPDESTPNVCFRSQVQQYNYQENAYGQYGFAGMNNSGTNITATYPSSFYQDDLISIYVLDGEGGKSLLKTFTVDINKIKGPKKWHGIK